MSEVGPNAVYMGWEGTLYFAAVGDNEFEDRLAAAMEAVTKGYRQPIQFGTKIARIQNVSCTINNVLREYYEIGDKLPVEIRSGNYSFNGNFRRGFVNGGMLRYLIGASSVSTVRDDSGVLLPGNPQHETPYFNITMDWDNAGTDATDLRVHIVGAKLQSWNPTFPQGEYVMENVTFRARGFKIEEAGY